MATLQFILSKRGNQILIYKGYSYAKHSETQNKITWRCQKRSICSVTLQTTNNSTPPQIYKEPTEHSHTEDWGAIEAKVRLSNIVSNAQREGLEDPSNLANDGLLGISSEGNINLPTRNSLKRRIRRAQEAVTIPIPAEITSIYSIPENYRMSLYGRTFLLHADENIVIFSTYEQLQVLSNSTMHLMDGTFKYSPSFFAQVYTIHSCERDNVLLTSIALLKNKTSAIYESLLNILSRKIYDLFHLFWTPLGFGIDFELGMISALSSIFPTANILGCLFHFSQLLFRCLQTNHLTSIFREAENHQLREHFRMLIALAFVPPHDVIQVFSRVLPILDPYLQPVYEFLSINYILGRSHNNNFLEPPFPILLWNCYERTLYHFHRTNNHVEGFHNKLNKWVSKNHAPLPFFLKKLKNLEPEIHRDIERSHYGFTLAQKKKKFKDLDMRLFNLASNYYSMDNIDYLKAIANNMIHHV